MNLSELGTLRRAGANLLYSLAVFGLAGCALFSSDSSLSLRLKEPGLKEVGVSPYIYELGEGGSGSAFVTAIQNCTITEKTSQTALWRQLLVGMKDIKVDRQEQVKLGGTPALLSVFSASLDDVPVQLACYTTRASNGCVTDYVIWAPLQTESRQSFGEKLSRFEQYVREQLPNGVSTSLMVNSFARSDDL